MDKQQRAGSRLGLRGFIGGWKQAGRRRGFSGYRPDLPLDQRRNDLDNFRRSFEGMEFTLHVGGRNKIDRSGERWSGLCVFGFWNNLDEQQCFDKPSIQSGVISGWNQIGRGQ